MAGGIFIQQNKVRPGFYHKFTAAPKTKNLFGEIGVAAIPIALDWGTDEEMIVLHADASEREFYQKLGYPKDHILPVREILKRAKTLIAYRINGAGDKAELDMTPQPVMVAAKHAGERGNAISVAIEEEDSGSGKYCVKTYLDAVLQDEQNGVLQAEDIQDNDWVTFAGAGSITAAAGGTLTGGTNSTPHLSDYAQFLILLESYDCNAFGTMSNDMAIKELFVQAAKKRIDELGRMGQCVLCDMESGHEAVISVKNGVILRDGTVIDKQTVVAWLIGAAASAGPAQSLTYTAYDEAIGPDIRLSNEAIEQALQKGQIVFVARHNEYGDPVAVIEQDVNTLTRFTKERPPIWGKNRVVRSLQFLVNSLSRIWHLYYVGKVDNNAIGRGLFKADLAALMRTLNEQGAFENFDAEKDIRIEKGSTSDSVVAQMAVQPVDAMEKIYFTVEVH